MGHARYSIGVSQAIPAPATRVWESLTRAHELDRWFSEGTTFDARPGGRMHNRDGDEWVVTRFVEGKRIQFVWQNRSGGGAEYAGSLLEFEIGSSENGTLVRFGQSDLATRQAALAQAEGWSWALHSLESYLATGRGVRYADWEAAGKP
jgi:uncharacterized protein YndB with AHSA1/START domain